MSFEKNDIFFLNNLKQHKEGEKTKKQARPTSFKVSEKDELVSIIYHNIAIFLAYFD